MPLASLREITGPALGFAIPAACAVWRFALRRPRCPVRLLLARPLWHLGAWAIGVPDRARRYRRFREDALHAWEEWLLGDTPRHRGKDRK